MPNGPTLTEQIESLKAEVKKAGGTDRQIEQAESLANVQGELTLTVLTADGDTISVAPGDEFENRLWWILTHVLNQLNALKRAEADAAAAGQSPEQIGETEGAGNDLFTKLRRIRLWLDDYRSHPTAGALNSKVGDIRDGLRGQTRVVDFLTIAKSVQDSAGGFTDQELAAIAAAAEASRKAAEIEKARRARPSRASSASTSAPGAVAGAERRRTVRRGTGFGR